MKKLLPNQLVKILFRNGTSVEGIVDIWDGDYVLRSEDGKSVLIIQNPEQDIMLVKVILNEEAPVAESLYEDREKRPKPVFSIQKEENEDPEDAFSDFSGLDSMSLRAKKLSQLHLAAVEEERKIITARLNNHQITEVKPVNYGYPNILNKKGK